MNKQTISSKKYVKPEKVCCIDSLENCNFCPNKSHCLVLKEQLAFYNRLGIPQISDDVSADSLSNLKDLWQDSSRVKRYDPSWNYAEDNTRAYTHSIHPYPAMMIPQVAGRLIDMYANPKAVVLDPFCGSGSVLLEAFMRGYDAYGIDINPLSLLISRVKTTPLNYKILQDKLEEILEKTYLVKNPNIPNFFNIDYWFKPEVISKLTALKIAIDSIKERSIKDFFRVVLSKINGLAYCYISIWK